MNQAREEIWFSSEKAKEFRQIWNKYINMKKK